MEFKPHSHQKKVLHSPRRFILASSGIQGGKTLVGAVWMLQQIEKKGFDKNYLLAAPSYKLLQQSTLRKFFEVLGDVTKLGQYRKADGEIRLPDGGRLFIRSAEEPNLLEGMTIDGAVWLDEAGQMSRQVWVNMQGRTAIARAPVLMTTTPYAVGAWVKREIIAPFKEGDKDYDVIEWTSVDNPYFSKEEYDRCKRTMSDQDFSMRYEGKWIELHGLVYPDFNEKCIIDPIPLKPDWTYFCGVDFGYTNPTACVWLAKTAEGDYYVIDEYFQRNKTSTENAVEVLIREKRLPSPVKYHYCDYTAPQQISEWSKSGVKRLASMKIDKLASIRRVTEFIRTGKFKVFKTCRELIREMEFYHFATSKIENEAFEKEDPVKTEDHGCDAMRYALYSSAINDGTIIPKLETETPKPSEAETLRTLIEKADEGFDNLKLGKKKVSALRPLSMSLYLEHA